MKSFSLQHDFHKGTRGKAGSPGHLEVTLYRKHMGEFAFDRSTAPPYGQREIMKFSGENNDN